MSRKLLLADDSVTIQRVIELTFADEDIDVITVGDGQRAIERIDSDRPDIVLADISMPERDGYEVAAFVKHDAQLSHIPVVLLTGAFERVDEQRAREVQAAGVLAKPFEPQAVISQVKDLLSRRRPAEPQAAARPPVKDFSYRPAETRLPDPGPAAGAAPMHDHHTPHTAAHLHQPVSPEPAFSAHERLPADFDARARDHSAADAVRRSTDRISPESVAQNSSWAGEPAPVTPPWEEDPVAAHSGWNDEPQAAAPAADSLDDYFDRLDAAFANLGSGTAVEVPRLDDLEAPAPYMPPARASAPVQAATPAHDRPVQSFPAPVARHEEPAPAEIPRAFVTEAPRLEPTPARSNAHLTPTSFSVPAAASAGPQPPLADAFAALLAAEQGKTPAPLRAVVATPPAVAATPAVADDLVEQVTKRVLERLNDRVVRESVSEVVLKVAERMVRDEIERIKAAVR